MTFGKPQRLKLVARGTNLIFKELELSAPLSRPPGKEEELKVAFNYQWSTFNQLCLCNVASIIAENNGTCMASGLVSMCSELVHLQKAGDSCASPLWLALCTSLSYTVL